MTDGQRKSNSIESNPIVSVIIPAYNVQAYVEKAIRSVMASTLKDIEIIVINDGSTDSTPEICDRLAAEDSRIRVIHQKNAGVSTARNNGLKAACGKYFAFADGDDYIEPKMYEQMVASLEETGAEMACCSYRTERDGETVYINHLEHGLMNREELLYATWERRHVGTCATNKLALKSLQEEKEIFFNPKWYVCEDGAFWTDYICEISKAVILPEDYYHYVLRDTSATHSKDMLNPKRLTECDARQYIIEKYRMISSELAAAAEAENAGWWASYLFLAYCYLGMNDELKKLKSTIDFSLIKKTRMKSTRKIYTLGCALITKYGLGLPLAKAWFFVRCKLLGNTI